MPIGKRLGAEFLGTFLLVLIGCGTAVLAPSTAFSAVGHLGTAVAIGAAAAAMLYALGHVSGAHLNPVVTLGMFVGRRFPSRDVMPYMLAQIAGATAGAILLYLVASGRPAFQATPYTLGANGFAELSMGRFPMISAMVTEIALAFAVAFVFVSTSERRSMMAVAPVAVGLAYATAHLVTLPVTGASLNPARSTAIALLARGVALKHIWLFWLAPLVGGALAGAVHLLFSRAAAAAPVDE